MIVNLKKYSDPIILISMNTKRIILGTIAYTIGTFSLAVTWHVFLFESRYQSFGYFEVEPGFVVGFVAILIQGVILSALFPMVKLTGTGVARGIKYSFLVGAFFWTSHVLAFVAKQNIQDVGLFIAMETLYLSLQFGLFGILIGTIYRTDLAD